MKMNQETQSSEYSKEMGKCIRKSTVYEKYYKTSYSKVEQDIIVIIDGNDMID
jgi:hypothetical protein